MKSRNNENEFFKVENGQAETYVSNNTDRKVK